jgi:hypothetical protein
VGVEEAIGTMATTSLKGKLLGMHARDFPATSPVRIIRLASWSPSFFIGMSPTGEIGSLDVGVVAIFPALFLPEKFLGGTGGGAFA